MNSHITNISKQENGEPIIEEVYGIIDTKIQYIDYLTNKAVQPFINQESISGGSTFAKSRPIYSKGNNDDNFLNQIEANSKQKHLLLIIRTTLCIENAQAAFELLTDNKFLNHTEKTLSKCLEEALIKGLTR